MRNTIYCSRFTRMPSFEISSLYLIVALKDANYIITTLIIEQLEINWVQDKFMKTFGEKCKAVFTSRI